MGKENYLNELKEFVKRASVDFKVDEVVLFGSRAREDYSKDSDIDLIIVSDDFNDMNVFERAAKMYDYWELNMAVDFICYTVKEFNRLKKKISIVSQALKEGLIIR